jgi:hypothetical protein
MPGHGYGQEADAYLALDFYHQQAKKTDGLAGLIGRHLGQSDELETYLIGQRCRPSPDWKTDRRDVSHNAEACPALYAHQRKPRRGGKTTNQ